MPYLLDSDYVIHYLQDAPGAIAIYPALSREGFSMSAVTYMEAYEGILAAEDRVAALKKLNDLLSAVVLIDFDQDAAIVCAQLRARLRSEGKRVNQRAHDLQIAATAVLHRLTVVTRNVADFGDLEVAIRTYSIDAQ